MTTEQDQPGRMAELDGLRAIAVCMVLTWHFLGAIIDHRLGPWSIAVSRVTILGRTGVDLFFVLSGFLITSIVLERRQAALRFLATFYARRALRIIPPYALLALVFWAIVVAGVHTAAFNADTPWWRHATFTQNLWMADAGRWGPNAISVTWSVAIEEHFYLFFPLVALAAPPRRLPSILVAVALLSCLFRAASYLGPASSHIAYVHTLSRLDGLAVGGLLAHAWRHPAFAAWFGRNRSALRRLLLAAAVSVPLLTLVIARDFGWHMFTWAHTYLTLLSATLLLYVLGSLGSSSARWLRMPALRRVGRLSYSIYLFHPLLLSLVFLLAQREELISGAADVALAALALALTWVWASLSMKWYEKPLIDYGRRMSY